MEIITYIQEPHPNWKDVLCETGKELPPYHFASTLINGVEHQIYTGSEYSPVTLEDFRNSTPRIKHKVFQTDQEQAPNFFSDSTNTETEDPVDEEKISSKDQEPQEDSTQNFSNRAEYNYSYEIPSPDPAFEEHLIRFLAFKAKKEGIPKIAKVFSKKRTPSKEEDLADKFKKQSEYLGKQFKKQSKTTKSDLDHQFNQFAEAIKKKASRLGKSFTKYNPPHLNEKNLNSMEDSNGASEQLRLPTEREFRTDLELFKTTRSKDVRSKYRQLIKKYHPDRFSAEHVHLQEWMKSINIAHDKHLRKSQRIR